MLIVFDVDGTLTRTSELDAEEYARAFHEVFGHPLVRGKLDPRFRTDAGVASVVLERERGRPADPESLAALRRRFLERLRVALAVPNRELAVPGAGDALRDLEARGHRVALATGCWEPSARLKLGAAGVDATGLPAATSDDSPDREEILRIALRRAGPPVDGRIVYVADAPWDAAVCGRLSLPLVGIDHAGSGRLDGLGVSHVLRSFADLAGLRHALRAAEVPA